MNSRPLALLAMIATTALLGACGGADDAGHRSAPAARAGDDGIGRGSLLRLEDLPAGWTANAASERTGGCDGIEAAKRTASARANSATFSRDATTIASGTVYVFRTSAAPRPPSARSPRGPRGAASHRSSSAAWPRRATPTS